MFVDSGYDHNKVTGIFITGLFLVVGSTSTTWSSKLHNVVQTSTFRSKFTALKNNVKESVIIWYHLRSMDIKVSKHTHMFVDNMSVVLNAKNPGVAMNKKTVALSYHFVRYHVSNIVLEVRKIHTSDNCSDPFTKPLVIKYFHCFTMIVW